MSETGTKDKGRNLADDLAQARWTAHPEDINHPHGRWMIVEDYFGEAHIIARDMGHTEALFVAHHDPATMTALYKAAHQRGGER